MMALLVLEIFDVYDVDDVDDDVSFVVPPYYSFVMVVVPSGMVMVDGTRYCYCGDGGPLVVKWWWWYYSHHVSLPPVVQPHLSMMLPYFWMSWIEDECMCACKIKYSYC